MKLDAITYKIIGCSMKIHNNLGNGFQEVIYQRCLAIELEKARLSFAREKEQPILNITKIINVNAIKFLIYIAAAWRIIWTG